MTSVSARMASANSASAENRFPAALRSEWTKLVTVGSIPLTIVASAAVSVGLGAALMFAHLDFWSGMTPQERASVDAVFESLMGLWFFGMLGFAVAGALTITGEYSTGTIHATFAAVPRRLHVFGAKAAIVGLTTLAATIATSFVSFFVSQPIMAQESLDVSIGDDGVLLAVVGGGLYVTCVALIGLALGTIMRRTVATLIAITGIFFLAAIISQIQPESWSSITQFLPHAAGMAVMSSIDNPDLLSPPVGLLVLAGWTTIALAIAAFLLERRDVEA